jgi:hypothetical protein
LGSSTPESARVIWSLCCWSLPVPVPTIGWGSWHIKTYRLVHAGTSNAERTKRVSTWFHHTALGQASTTTNGVDTGFIRELAGTLNSMTTGGASTFFVVRVGCPARGSIFSGG